MEQVYSNLVDLRWYQFLVGIVERWILVGCTLLAGISIPSLELVGQGILVGSTVCNNGLSYLVMRCVVFWSRFMAQDSCPTEDPKHPQVDRRPESRRI